MKKERLEFVLDRTKHYRLKDMVRQVMKELDLTEAEVKLDWRDKDCLIDFLMLYQEQSERLVS